MARTYRRRRKLVKPGLQLKSTLVFLATGCIGVLVQTIVLFNVLTDVAHEVPNDGAYVLSVVPRMLTMSTLVTFALLIPLTLSVGIMATFRFAGPLYRMEQFLKQVVAGEQPDDCRLREVDELQDFCELLNQATAAARRPADEDDADEPMPLARAS